jgi:FtsZ-interacting cell division protein ZipA
MFNSISWQEFLIIIAVAITGYYVITTLLLYSGEITRIFKQKESKQIDSDTHDDQSGSNETNDLMGKIKYETEVNVPREGQERKF